MAADALPFLLDALKAEPKSVEIHYLVAQMLRIKGRYSESMKHMRDAEMATQNGRISTGDSIP